MSLIGIPCVLKADFCGLGVVQVGKLLVFESGAVKLQMGDVLLDVAAGTPCQFRQEVASINAREGHFVFLGDVAQRVVCSPNVEQLIRSASCCIGNCFVGNHTHFVLKSSWSVVCCNFTIIRKIPYPSGLQSEQAFHLLQQPVSMQHLRRRLKLRTQLHKCHPA